MIRYRFLKSMVRFWKSAPVSVSLMFLNILVFLLYWVLDFAFGVPIAWHMILNSEYVKATNEWYLLITAFFSHIDLLHLASNMLGIYILGFALEKTIGPWRYLLLYFLSGVGSSLAIVFLTNSTALGASGAIYGVMAGLLYITFIKPHWFTYQSVRTIRTLTVINIIFTFLIPNISVVGHLGGLGVGLLLSTIFIPEKPYYQRRINKMEYGHETIEDDDQWIH